MTFLMQCLQQASILSVAFCSDPELEYWEARILRRQNINKAESRRYMFAYFKRCSNIILLYTAYVKGLLLVFLFTEVDTRECIRLCKPCQAVHAETKPKRRIVLFIWSLRLRKHQREHPSIKRKFPFAVVTWLLSVFVCNALNEPNISVFRITMR